MDNSLAFDEDDSNFFEGGDISYAEMELGADEALKDSSLDFLGGSLSSGGEEASSLMVGATEDDIHQFFSEFAEDDVGKTFLNSLDENDITVGLELMVNTKLSEAEEIFQRKKDTDLWFALYYAQVAFLRTYYTGERHEEALERIQAANKLAKEIYYKFNKTLWDNMVKTKNSLISDISSVSSKIDMSAVSNFSAKMKEIDISGVSNRVKELNFGEKIGNLRNYFTETTSNYLSDASKSSQEVDPEKLSWEEALKGPQDKETDEKEADGENIEEEHFEESDDDDEELPKGESESDEEEEEKEEEKEEKQETTEKDSKNKDEEEVDLEERNKLTLDSMIVIAECNGMLSMLYFWDSSYVKAAICVRTSWGWYSTARQECQRQISSGFDVSPKIKGLINFGVGFFHFIMSMVPGNFRWVVEAVGFEASRATALDELESCRDTHCSKSWLATLTLAAIQWGFVGDYEEYENLLSEVETIYPCCYLMKTLQAYVHKKGGNLDLSIECLQSGLNDLIDDPLLSLSINYQLGYCYYLLNEWYKAIPIFETYINESNANVYKILASYHLGFCYWVTGNKSSIRPVYLKALDASSDHAWDKYALRKIRNFLTFGEFLPFEEHFNQAWNLVEAGQFKQAMGHLKKIPPYLRSDYKGHIPLGDCVALFRFMKGCVFLGADLYKQAKPHFEKVVSLEERIEHEKYIVPYSYFHLGEMAKKENNFEEAGNLLRKALRYSNFDFAQNLGFHANRLLIQMEGDLLKEKAPASTD